MSSAYFMDVAPQYRDNGCPSQCMGMNEYSTVSDMYSFSTSPTTPLLSADPLMQASPAVNTVPDVLPGLPNLPSNFKMPTNYTTSRFQGPGVKYTGAQMAKIVTGYEMANPMGGRKTM